MHQHQLHAFRQVICIQGKQARERLTEVSGRRLLAYSAHDVTVNITAGYWQGQGDIRWQLYNDVSIISVISVMFSGISVWQWFYKIQEMTERGLQHQ